MSNCQLDVAGFMHQLFQAVVVGTLEACCGRHAPIIARVDWVIKAPIWATPVTLGWRELARFSTRGRDR